MDLAGMPAREGQSPSPRDPFGGKIARGVAVATALASPLGIVGLGPQVSVGSQYAVAPFFLIVLIGEA
jgi:hypothetical protein